MIVLLTPRISKKSKEYIVQRANINFFNELELYQIEVNYDDSIKIDLSNSDLFELSNYPNITYWVIYTYRNKGIKYAFGLEFDKSGNTISKAKFPDSSLNPKFETLTKPCLALKKVKSDKRFKGKKVQFIKLSYLHGANSFCWLIQEEYNVADHKKIEFEKWYNYSEKKFYVNENTNKIEKIEDQKKQIIYSGYNLKKTNHK